MPAKKTTKTSEPVRPGQHTPVQVARPDADVYYINEAARERYEAQKK